MGSPGFGAQGPSKLAQETIALDPIVVSARRHDIGPLVKPTSTSRHHVVDRVPSQIAIGTAMVIAGQDRHPRKWRNLGLGGNPHIVSEPQHRGNCDDGRGRPERQIVTPGGNHVDSACQPKGDRSARTHELKRFVGCVEEQDTTVVHRCLPVTPSHLCSPLDHFKCLVWRRKN